MSPTAPRTPMIFYALSILVSAFCAVALGLGPAMFALGGLGAATVGFRHRRTTWWGLALAVAGAAEGVAALGGIRTLTVAELTAGAFTALALLRIASRGPNDRGRSGYAR